MTSGQTVVRQVMMHLLKKKGEYYMKKISWAKKYELAISEYLNTNGIMQLRDCGRPRATSIREDAIKYCIEHNLYFDVRNIPTSSILAVTGLNIEYYYNKMIDENKLLQLGA